MARILVLSPYEPPADGIAQHTKNLAHAWVNQGHSVLVMAPRGPAPSSGETEGDLSVSRSVSIVPRPQTWHLARDFSPNVVVAQFALAALSVNLWSMRDLCRRFRAQGVPIVVIFHEPEREFDMLGLGTRFLYRRWSQVTSVPVALSSTGASALERTGLFSSITHVPHGTDAPLEVAAAERERVRTQYGLERPTVTTLGFTTFDKGIDVLIEAAPRISSAVPEVQILIAGAPRPRRGLFRMMGRRDQRHLRDLHDHARRYPHGSFTFVGYIPDADVTPLLALSEVVVLPYRRITQSGIAARALASGAAIVASDLPGLRDSLGPAALFVAPNDPAALGEAIANLLDEGERPRLHRLRELAVQETLKNTYDVIASQILELGLHSPR